jgi:hypothetical protein
VRVQKRQNEFTNIRSATQKALEERTRSRISTRIKSFTGSVRGSSGDDRFSNSGPITLRIDCENAFARWNRL